MEGVKKEVKMEVKGEVKRFTLDGCIAAGTTIVHFNFPFNSHFNSQNYNFPFNSFFSIGPS